MAVLALPSADDARLQALVAQALALPGDAPTVRTPGGALDPDASKRNLTAAPKWRVRRCNTRMGLNAAPVQENRAPGVERAAIVGAATALATTTPPEPARGTVRKIGSTLDGYRSKLQTHLVLRLGKLPHSAAFEVARSREVDVALVAAGATISTRRNVFLGLRSVARFAVEAKLLPHEPKFLPLPKRGKRVPSAPPAEDVAALIDAACCPEHHLVILLAAHAGLRKGEIRALRCMDVELENDRLIVRRSRYRGHTRTTKSGHEREVPLSPQLKAALMAARVPERHRKEEVALSTRGKSWAATGRTTRSRQRCGG